MNTFCFFTPNSMYNYALKFNFLEVKIAVRESGVERS